MDYISEHSHCKVYSIERQIRGLKSSPEAEDMRHIDKFSNNIKLLRFQNAGHQEILCPWYVRLYASNPYVASISCEYITILNKIRLFN